jgi:hypothetical protein
MGWKNLPTWLKFGISFSVIDIILIILGLVTSSPKEADIMVLHFIQIPLTYTAEAIFGDSYIQSFSILILGGLATWFLIGALIGWIVGKIKK